MLSPMRISRLQLLSANGQEEHGQVSKNALQLCVGMHLSNSDMGQAAPAAASNLVLQLPHYNDAQENLCSNVYQKGGLDWCYHHIAECSETETHQVLL